MLCFNKYLLLHFMASFNSFGKFNILAFGSNNPINTYIRLRHGCYFKCVTTCPSTLCITVLRSNRAPLTICVVHCPSDIFLYVPRFHASPLWRRHTFEFFHHNVSLFALTRPKSHRLCYTQYP